MFYWIYDIPNELLAVLCAAAFVGFTCGGLLVARPLVLRWLGPPPAYNDLVSYTLSAYGVFYGLMLGLIAVGTSQDLADVDAAVTNEATTLRALYRDASEYPAPIRGELRSALREYCRFVIETEWPQQRQGIVPEGGNAKIDDYQKKLFSFEPVRKSHEIIHAEVISRYNTLIEQRGLRMHSVTTSLSPALWYVVIIGAVLNIVLTWLFSVEKRSVHLALSGILAVFIGLMIFLVAAMDNPFRGEFSISPEVFEQVRTMMGPGSGMTAAQTAKR